MVNEMLLKETLIGLVENSRAHFEVLTGLISQNEALIDTVRSLDSGIDALLEGKRVELQARLDSLGRTLTGAIEQHNLTIQKLQDSLLY